MVQRPRLNLLHSSITCEVAVGGLLWLLPSFCVIDATFGILLPVMFQLMRRYPTRPFDPKLLERDCFICQPTAFIRASAYRRCSLNPEVNQPFDYDLWIRMAKQGFHFAWIPDYLANSRVHAGSKTICERSAVFHSSMRLLKQHYGYIPFPWVFGYTAYRMDGRDQFFEPLRPTLPKYVASLPMGLWLNPAKPFRFLREWFTAPFGAIRRRVSRRHAARHAAAFPVRGSVPDVPVLVGSSAGDVPAARHAARPPALPNRCDPSKCHGSARQNILSPKWFCAIIPTSGDSSSFGRQGSIDGRGSGAPAFGQ
jgi:hypothetical protein